jgi:hypothetical protein
VRLVLGVALGAALPSVLSTGGADRTVFALFLEVAMCVSAIPVIAKTLRQRRRGQRWPWRQVPGALPDQGAGPAELRLPDLTGVAGW